MNLNWLKSFLGVSKDQPEQYILVDIADKGKIQNIKSAIAQSETGLALDCLVALNIKSIENETIVLNARFQSLQNDQIKGILSSDEYRLQENRIHHDLLTLTGRLEKSLEPEKIIREIKVNLRKRYQKRYKDKLADRLPINIQCAYSIEGTGQEYAEVAFDEIVLTQNQVRENIEYIFDRHRGRLLIIGEPGAGKTTLLLQLAEALLQRPENRVPVILNLSTWRGQHKNLTHWLLHNIPAAAAVSKSMAKSLVLEDRLLPLFDGLDEVLAEHRNACLEAIADYGSDANHQYVICSRTQEYIQTSSAPVFGQVKLLPLSQEQIIQHLEISDQPEARFLLHAMKTRPLLAKAIEAPFYFNTAQLLLASMKSLNNLDIRANDEADMKAALVEKFVQEKLSVPIRWAFPAAKSGKWLGFLAKNMEERGLTNFELADLNLSWLGSKPPTNPILRCI
ncbi:MAG: NACHT domain-containing protein [Saprospiraceae bacterium]|nr:NACHT domain-containing protein [Saprospiraceae bacterium]